MLRGLVVAVVLIVSTTVLGTLAILLQLVVPRWRPTQRLGRVWAQVLLRTAGVRVRTEGTEKLEEAGAAVVVANHCSNFDIYSVLVSFSAPFCFVAKAELFRIPIFGTALRVAGFVPVERENREKAIASLSRAAEVLAAGASVLFFPEGTRSPDGRLRRFKKGAFVTAIQNGVPVVPVAINGAHAIQPGRSLVVRPGVVRLAVADPIPTAGLTLEDRNRILDLARARLAERLDPAQRPASD